MSNRFPQLSPVDHAPLRLVNSARSARSGWASCLPLGELVVIAFFGLVLVMA